MKYNSGYESLGFDSFDRGAQVYCCADAKGYGSTAANSWSNESLDSKISTLECNTSAATSSISELADAIAKINIPRVSADDVGRALKELADRIGYKVNDDWTVGLKTKGNWGGMSRLTRSQLKTI